MGSLLFYAISNGNAPNQQIQAIFKKKSALQHGFDGAVMPVVAQWYSLQQKNGNSEKLELVATWCLLYVQSYLEISSITRRLQCQCYKPTIYHRFVDILPRYDLL